MLFTRVNQQRESLQHVYTVLSSKLQLCVCVCVEHGTGSGGRCFFGWLDKDSVSVSEHVFRISMSMNIHVYEHIISARKFVYMFCQKHDKGSNSPSE